MASDPHLGELIDVFVQEMPGRISALQAQANTRNWEQLAQMARQLKGSVGSYGFPQITSYAAALEVAARDAQQEDQILAPLNELLSLCRRAQSITPLADQSAPNAPFQSIGITNDDDLAFPYHPAKLILSDDDPAMVQGYLKQLVAVSPAQ